MSVRARNEMRDHNGRAPSDSGDAARGLRTLVAGECHLLREGLRSTVSGSGLQVVAEVQRLEDLPRTARTTGSDVAFVALLNGIEISALFGGLERLLRRCAAVFLLSSASFKANSKVLASGACVPCLPLTAAPEEIVGAARRAVRANGSPAGTGRIMGRAVTDGLTDRELEVLNVMALGKSNREIALRLFVTTATVKAHLTSIYRKLGVKSRSEAVVAYLERLS